MPYDPIKDFTPVMKLAEGPYVLVVNPSLPEKSVRELIALAKAKPGTIDYASSGNGSAQHLVGALFMTMAGAQLNHVPYKGSNQAMNDVIGGQVKVSFVGVPNALPNLAQRQDQRARGHHAEALRASCPTCPRSTKPA